MDLITRQFGFLCLGALAAALTACASNNVSQCDAQGILCPSGTHCAAAQPICIADSNLCGDAHMDPGEECDDGNTKDGDGCSHECKIETCGNGHTDFGEVCDLGPGKNGVCMGCAADCKSFETCGDGVLDTACNEVCDDHNTKDGDGCSHDCKSTEICGNKIIDTEVGEVCDDGPLNGTPGDPCDITCRSNRSCGNAKVDTDQGEECDAGAFGAGNTNGNNDNNDCRANCLFNRCGDGLVDKQAGLRHEDCDGGSLIPDSHNQPIPTPAETVDCNIDCTTPSCGDGKVNHHFMPDGTHGEQCDSGTVGGVNQNQDSNACTSTCQVNVCGDHHTLTGLEQCDDGGVNTANCNANCTTPKCGDGLVNVAFKPDGVHPEQCDNGTIGTVNQNQDSAACTSACQINVCGDHHVLQGVEQCDSGGIDAVDCDPDCTVPVCGDGHVNHAAHEACDDGAANGTAASPTHCNQFCQFNGCGDGIVEPGEQCDAGSGGTKQNSAACNSDCTFAKCGDGFPNPAAGEDCDEGAANGTLAGPTHCNQFCHFNSCGNGILEPGEQCDDGTDSMGHNNNHAGARCNASCQLNVCGDGDKLEGVEQCDPGKDALGHVQDTADCDHDCTFPVCGDGLPNTHANEQCDEGVLLNGLPGHCDLRCKSPLCGNGVVDVNVDPIPDEECDDGVNGVQTDSARCNGNCTFARCGDTTINHAAGETCDDGPGLNGIPCDYGNPGCMRCNATCNGHINPGGPFCGDGIVQTNETCDPTTGPATTLPSTLARADSAGCDIDCTAVTCSDGHLNIAAGESCDDHNNSACGTCPSVTDTDCRGMTPTQPTQAHTTVQTTDVGPPANIQTGQGFTLDDGFGKSVTFEFVKAGDTPVNGTDTQIPFTQSPPDSAAIIAASMAAAINGVSGFGITASVPVDQTNNVILTNRRKSAIGNTTIINNGLTFVYGLNGQPDKKMAGGLAGDCGLIGCVVADDCETGVCSSGSCQLCTSDIQCPASTVCNTTNGKCH